MTASRTLKVMFTLGPNGDHRVQVNGDGSDVREAGRGSAGVLQRYRTDLASAPESKVLELLIAWLSDGGHIANRAKSQLIAGRDKHISLYPDCPFQGRDLDAWFVMRKCRGRSASAGGYGGCPPKSILFLRAEQPEKDAQRFPAP